MLVAGNTAAYWRAPFGERSLHHCLARGQSGRIAVSREIAVTGDPEVAAGPVGAVGRILRDPCPVCGQMLTAGRRDSVFCSGRCRQAAHRAGRAKP